MYVETKMVLYLVKLHKFVSCTAPDMARSSGVSEAGGCVLEAKISSQVQTSKSVKMGNKWVTNAITKLEIAFLKWLPRQEHKQQNQKAFIYKVTTKWNIK